MTEPPAADAPASKAGAAGARTNRWSRLVAARYGLTAAEARAELRRLIARGFQTWELSLLAREERRK
ncbi:hypothetical protein [Streptomyces sp. HGB0020]|uniref:hypothetical protein n=1 Tax=Streptomyces sp. HGB0020 TaxID=1078086 RepID=UPI00034E7060|nr:hypothetical protein [Streptomyces sp. HGB0020]EPD62386.1 hypothetical protein HMPREF1211_04020 [Streptomyces sp. HGB0020]